MTKAEELWHYQGKFLGIESELHAIMPKEYHDFTHDEYDGSIEIYGIDRVLTVAEINGLKEFGFRQCWTHSKESRDDKETMERCYPLWKMGT